MAHDENNDWNFFRKAAQNVLWPHVEQEYRDELQRHRRRRSKPTTSNSTSGMSSLSMRGSNSPYYVKGYDKSTTRHTSVPEHCSAFVATGSYTKDGKRRHRPQ